MPLKITKPRLAAAAFLLAVLFAVGSGSLSLTADTAAVTVEPDQAYAGDTIRVTVSGYPGDYFLPAGAVEVGGVRLPLPGIFGQPGSRAKTDREGRVTFRTALPFEVPPGPQKLIVDSVDGKTKNSADINVLTPLLSVFPNPAVPNQMVTITGTGFTPSTVRGGEGALNSHQITGGGKSRVSFTGTPLGPRYADYPIDLDSDGGLHARVRVPSTYLSQSGGSVEVEVRDSFGRTGRVSLGFRSPEVHVDPKISGSGSGVTVTGYGFAAGDGADSGCKKVDVSYNSTKLTTAKLGPSGGFTAIINVPPGVAASTNTVTATMPGCVGNISASVKHTIPARYVTLSSSAVVVGETVTVTGYSQKAHTTVTQADIDGVWDELGVATTTPTSVLPTPAPTVDANGVFSFTFVVPALTEASHTLHLKSGDDTTVKYFVVTPAPTETTLTAAAPTPTPMPTPIPKPTPTPGPPEPVKPATALTGVKENLVRAWSSSKVTGWTFYDPREEFEGLYTLNHLIPGGILWLDVRADQTVVLNGRERKLVLGWNLVRW